MKQIAEALAEMGWADITLALREFGVGYDEDFHGGLYEFVLDALGGISDEKLIDLSEYLTRDDRDPASPATGGPWDREAFRLFLSHTHEHRKFAGALREEFRRTGIDAFVAHDTIKPTKQWEGEIESALRTCDALLALLTPEFLTSKWCDQEVGLCVARSVPIVPIRKPETPHGFIGEYQALTPAATARPISVASDVFDLLATHEQTRSRMARPIVQRFVRSGSFQGTRDNFPALSSIPKAEWTDQVVDDVLSAIEQNLQIKEAFLADGGPTPVPEAVRSHLSDMDLLPPSPADDDIPF